MNLSTCPCSKLSVLLSSLSSSLLPFSPYTWKQTSASVPALGRSDVQIHKDQGCSKETNLSAFSFPLLFLLLIISNYCSSYSSDASA